LAPLKPLPLREVVRKLEKAGFRKVSQRGSHMKFESSDGSRTAIVPAHSEIAVGTLRSILRQASIAVDEFIEL
jgi:predicted RNA binding protein YcfA (HicA-like mRNA interferase family)